MFTIRAGTTLLLALATPLLAGQDLRLPIALVPPGAEIEDGKVKLSAHFVAKLSGHHEFKLQLPKSVANLSSNSGLTTERTLSDTASEDTQAVSFKVQFPNTGNWRISIAHTFEPDSTVSDTGLTDHSRSF